MNETKTDTTGVWQLEDGRLRIKTAAKDPETGKMVHRQRTLDENATMEDAVRRRDELKAQIKAKDASQQPIITVADYAERWLKAKSARVKPSTADRYLKALSDRILPQIGEIRLDQLNRRDVVEWTVWAENARKSNGELYSTATVEGWWSVLSTMLQDAFADGYLDRDPTFRVDRPDTGVDGRREHRTLDPNQLRALVDVCQEDFPHRYPEIATLGYTGCRAGELYALQWDDVDLPDARPTIRRSVWQGEVTSTKTGDPRIVPLPELVVDALNTQLCRLKRQEHPGLEANLVFPSDKGTHRRPQSLQHCLEKSCERAEIDIHVTPQVLRRTYNQLLRRAQVDRVVLREIMGHSSEQMTERYSSVPEEEKQSAVRAVFEEGHSSRA